MCSSASRDRRADARSAYRLTAAEESRKPELSRMAALIEFARHSP